MLARHAQGREVAPRPTARNKWLVASVVEDAASVVSRILEPDVLSMARDAP